MLERTQATFLDCLLDRECDADFIQSTSPLERLSVYRNTMYENLRNALELTFPGVWKLLGEECANSVAKAFCKKEGNLPTTGCLDDWGVQFPKFLAKQKELDAVPYIQDFAEYEWLRSKAFAAKDCTALTFADLERVALDQVDSLCFSFVPSLFKYFSDFPLDDIQHQVDDPSAEPLVLSDKKAYVLLARFDNQLCTYWVSESLWFFVNTLALGRSLAVAAEELTERYPDFDLTQSLLFLFQKKLVARLYS